MWLVAAGLAFFFVPLVLINNTIRTDTQRITADLNSAISQINTVPTPVPIIQQLAAQLTEVQSQTQQIAGANQQLTMAHPNRPAIMAALSRYDPNIVQLEALTSSDNRLTLSGRAVDQNTVVNYARTLEQSTLFNRVNVQSIRVLATPSVTRTPTLVSSAGSLTGTTPLSTTLDQRDEYESDNTDALAKPISIGAPQIHNFYPGLDVDVESFLAKSGRYYRVTTSDLAPGVDTFISVSVGDRVYINDDAKAGTLASEVAFQNTQVDVIAVIRTTNRGQYGVDKRYQLIVEEVVPTPAPTPGPAATAGAAVTPTVAPTTPPTSTPVPDLRDVYESDEITPKPIAVGQSQLHNFYPDGDFDQVQFLVKAGRFYRLYTTDLAAGVDTFLTVAAGATIYTNDDAKSGTLASEVIVGVTGADVIATARITNRGQFGSDKRYQLVLEEFVPTPGPTPTPTPTTPPDSRDVYEPDEVTPKPIAVGQSQLHNFYPDGDFDQVQFLVKTGRFYRVYTTDLAAGVDTLLTIAAGGALYTNDDAKPGTLASEVTFSVTGADVLATAQITNRGQAGADKQYQLVVEEFVPTPTVLSPSATPTNTPTPTPSPTASPDRRDAFELDDVQPAAIAIGEVQAHNFYPGNDVDKIVFNVKQNRAYVINTGNLALGVDTALTTTLNGGFVSFNDDYAPPGSNNVASAICFTATVDGPAGTTIVNQQPLYGATRAYSVTVNEVVSVPSPCAPPPAFLIVSPVSSLSGGQHLSAGLRPINIVRLVPTITWRSTTDRAARPSSALWTQASAPEFFGVEFVIIVELKVSAP